MREAYDRLGHQKYILTHKDSVTSRKDCSLVSVTHSFVVADVGLSILTDNNEQHHNF